MLSLFCSTDATIRVEEACSLEEVEEIRSCYNSDSKRSSKTTIDFPRTERILFRQCQEAAQSLAADRGTKALPILVALAFFVLAFIIAFAKATADLPDNKNVRTPHNIAFGAIYFWILPVVTLASIIGASQSQNAVPRILERLQEDVLLANGNKSSKFSLSSIDLRNPHTRTGGIYTWQMSKLKWSTYKGAGTSIKWTSAILFFLSLASVGSSFLIAVFISYQVPPTGWGCRGVLQSAIFASWVGSLTCDFFFQMKLEHRPRLLFWTTFIKDIVVTVATLTMMIYSSIGVFNRCMCWTNFGRAPLSFGAEPVIAAVLNRKLGHDWRYMASGGMLVQVFITTFACCLFSKGLVVLLQRDEDIPSASSFQEERRVPKSSESQDDLVIGYLGHGDVKFGSDFHVDSKPF